MNYHHLQYFWKVATLGSIARASAELELTQPTISEQIRALEKSLGRRLFDRVGRSLTLTTDGQRVLEYAEKIFALGAELTSALEHRVAPPPTVLRIGVERGISSRTVTKFLPDAPMVVVEGDLEGLIDQDFDVILSRQRIHKLHAHRLLDCGTVLLSRKKVKLTGAGILLPPEPMRSALKAWLKRTKLPTKVAATFDDEDLLLAYAERTDAVFAAPESTFRVEEFHRIARAPDLRYSLYGYTREPRPTHTELAARLTKTG